MKEGLRLLGELERIVGKKDLLKDVSKEIKDGLGKLTLEDFIYQGIASVELCNLIELYFAQFDATNLDREGTNDLRKVTKQIIPPQAYALFLGKRYL